MDAYSDQEDFARNLVGLCDLHLGGSPDSPARPPHELLKPGNCIVIIPTRGNFVYAGETAQTRADPQDMEFVPFPSPDSKAWLKSLMGSSLVGLSFGLRSATLSIKEPRLASSRLRDRFTVHHNGSPINSRSFSIKRKVLDRHGAKSTVRAFMVEVQALEDDLAHDALSDLTQYDVDLTYANRLTVDGLLEFLADMNTTLPSGMRLDTIFLSHVNFLLLASQNGSYAGARTPHANVLQVAGCTIIAHASIRDDNAYFTSFKDGPSLVRGPTVIWCEEDRLYIRHYCDMEHARDGTTPDIPAGFTVRLAPAPARNSVQEGQKIPVQGEALDQFLVMARTLQDMGEHDMALTMAEKAPRSGRDGARTSLTWEKILGHLGTDNDDLVASHNDLLVCINRLIESGFADDKLLGARMRVMRRLGLA